MSKKEGMNQKETDVRKEGILTVTLDKNLLFTCNILDNYRDTYRNLPIYNTVQSAEDHLTP